MPDNENENDSSLPPRMIGMTDADRIAYSQPAPDRIEIAPAVYAVKIRSLYSLSFPYHREAADAVQRWVSAHWEPSTKHWYMDAWRHPAVKKALTEIAEILTRNGIDIHTPPGKRSRITVLSGSLSAGNLIETPEGAFKVISTGVTFKGGAALRKQGYGHLVGKQVCYANLVELSPADFERLKKAQMQPEPAKSVDEQTPEPDF